MPLSIASPIWPRFDQRKAPMPAAPAAIAALVQGLSRTGPAKPLLANFPSLSRFLFAI
jgi:hypothetical protein